jgi:hypothetical protein
VGTGASTEAALNIGADGTTLVANSSSATGLVWQSYGSPNFVINGAQEIWQRGTSFTTTGTFSTSYTADRWQGYQGSAGTTQQTSRQASDLPGFRYFTRVTRPSGNSSTTYLGYWQTIETANSIPLAGQTVTLSFYARAGSGMTNSNTLQAFINSGTGVDEPNYAFTGNTTVVATNINILSSGGIVNGWKRYSVTGTIGSNMTEVGVGFTYTPTGTAGSNDYYDITGVQLEIGSVPTPFRRAGGTLQGELAACQRYYYRWTANATYSRYPVSGLAASTTLAFFPSITPVTLRAVPTAVESSTNWRVYDGASVVTGITIGIVVSTEAELQPYLTATASSGLTQYRPYMLTANTDASAYIGLSAEL